MKKTKLFLIYFVTLFIFLFIDFIWLGFIARDFYNSNLSYIFGKPNLIAALIFYLLYPVGLLFFVILPALKIKSFKKVLLNGAFFGFMCYATYDLTNLATIKNWPVLVSVIDIIWGTILSGVVSLLSFKVSNYFLNKK